MAKFCINCGKEMPENANVCPSCGAANGGAAPTQGATTVVVNTAQPKQSNGLAIAGFVVSLVSSLLCCGSFNVISLILSIIGLTKAKSLGGAGKGMAIAGIIISAIGLVLLLLLSILGYASAIIDSATTYGY